MFGPGRLGPQLPVFSHQVCLQNYTVQLKFWFSCEHLPRWYFRHHHIWDPSPLSGQGEAKKTFTSLCQTCRLAINVFYCELRHSFLDDNSTWSQKKENMVTQCKAHLLATRKFCCPISNSINVFSWKILKAAYTAEKFPCWGRGGGVDDVPPPCPVSSLCQIHSLPLCNRKQKPAIQSSG